MPSTTLDEFKEWDADCLQILLCDTTALNAAREGYKDAGSKRAGSALDEKDGSSAKRGRASVWIEAQLEELHTTRRH